MYYMADIDDIFQRKQIVLKPSVITAAPIIDEDEDKDEYNNDDNDNLNTFLKINNADNANDAIATELPDSEQENLQPTKTIAMNAKYLEQEQHNKEWFENNPDENLFLYPHLDDPNFSLKIASKKEFADAKYDGTIYNIKKRAEELAAIDFELLPQQAFIRNFMSASTPYNSIFLFHGLGSGKTCTGIGVTEGMRDYFRQMGINKQILIVASPNVQDNFRLQLFDERNLVLVDGLWTIRGCLGNKLLKEVNPTNMKGISREKIIKMVRNLINTSYLFLGYTQFANLIIRTAGDSVNEADRIRRLQRVFGDNLILIDEVHNIRISDDNANKEVAKQLIYLVSNVYNIRLLLLSATPMFNNYKEIIWIINLMNLNDKRGIVTISDIYDKSGKFLVDPETGEEIGRKVLIDKARGYISYVRGENPYTFPFRVMPNVFAPYSTFYPADSKVYKGKLGNKHKYPTYPEFQLNGKKIAKGIEKVMPYLVTIGKKQNRAYQYIIDQFIQNNTGRLQNTALGYSELLLPIQALIMSYPSDAVDEYYKSGHENYYLNESDSEDEDEDNDEDDNKDDENVEYINIIPSLLPKKNNARTAAAAPVTAPVIYGGRRRGKINIGTGTGTGTNAEFDTDTETESGLGFFYDDDDLNDLSLFGDDVLSILSGKSGTGTGTGTISTEGTNEDVSVKDAENLVRRYGVTANSLTGIAGLKRIMNFVDNHSVQPEKGKFEYREGMPHVFSPKQLKKYSAKIANVCKCIRDGAEGIIIVYSNYIDGGLIPMALALEEMGFTRHYPSSQSSPNLFANPPTPAVDVRTMRPFETGQDMNFIPAKYVMITGDPRLSPSNADAIKVVTASDNINGERVKVILLSQAGSEGLDFKGVRQLHCLDPWYNMNRIEQIIGRAIRNFGHKALPFEKRNAMIYLYGTLLSESMRHVEAADLYVIRHAEMKAIQIGITTRLLKEVSVDCFINYEQANFTDENFASQKIVQILADGQRISPFRVGDLPNTGACDYMESCEYRCVPDTNTDTNTSALPDKKKMDEYGTITYNEAFMFVNSDKITQKIRALMHKQYFYRKDDLIRLLNDPKHIPTEQIYAALTQLITDKNEYLVDKYGRTGHLINIGEYYLFQPSELNYPAISTFDRSVPIEYKHDTIRFQLKPGVGTGRGTTGNAFTASTAFVTYEAGRKILEEIHRQFQEVKQYQLSADTYVRKNIKMQIWEEECGFILSRLAREHNVDNGVLHMFVLDHFIESLMEEEKVLMYNWVLQNRGKDIASTMATENNEMDLIVNYIFQYMNQRIIRTGIASIGAVGSATSGLQGLLLFNGPSKVKNMRLYVLRGGVWTEAEAEDRNDLEFPMKKAYLKNTEMMSKFVGFIGFESNNQYLIFKLKDVTNKRSTGFRCDQAGKAKAISVMDGIVPGTGKSENLIYNIHEMCIYQEFLLRLKQHRGEEGKMWFVDPETAIYNDFDARTFKK